MRGWWSARPKATVWGDASARAFERPAPPLEVEPEPAPTGALFEPRPHEQLPTAPPAPMPASYAAPAVESSRTVRVTPTPTPTSPVQPPAPVGESAVVAINATAGGAPDQQAEFLRLFEVVTSMCDHVIEYIEADRAERQQMMDTLSELGRIITEGAATAVAALSAPSAGRATPAIDLSAEPPAPASSEPWAFARPSTTPPAPTGWGERVVGGSMDAGPAPHVDLVGAEVDLVPGTELGSGLPGPSDIAVEVRGRFGDRWVDGFEICEVMTTPSGPRYRLRRKHDGVVLPELFDAANIRRVESGAIATHQAPGADPVDDGQTTAERQRRERSMESHPSGSDPGTNGLNGSAGYWSRS